MFNMINTLRGSYNNLVGWWKLNAPSGTDLLGKFNSNVTGTPTAQTGPDGVTGSASGPFSDANYYSINFASANTKYADLMNNRKDYIIDFYAYFTSTPGFGDIILDMGSVGYYVRGNTGGGLQWASGDFASTVVTTTSFISTGTWYRVTLLSTAGINKKIYINGVLNVNSNRSGTLQATNNRLVMGRWGGAGGPFDVGYLSNFKLILGSNLADIPTGIK